jgi:hypothetical protein
LENKYIQTLELFVEMTNIKSGGRPNCEEIINRKDLWVLSVEEFVISDGLKGEIISKFNSKHKTSNIIYSILKMKLKI